MLEAGVKVRVSEVRGLLARQHEHEAVDRTPGIVRVPTAPAQPQPAVVVPEAEDAAIADRASNGFHGDTEPFVARLILVSKPQ